MTNAFDYKYGEEDRLDDLDAGPVSGVREHAFIDEDLPVQSVETGKISPQVPDAPSEAQPASWIGNLLGKLKKGLNVNPPAISTAPERFPMDEQMLVDELSMEERTLQTCREILLNRERIYRDALALGMTHGEIEESGDSPLDLQITQRWRERVAETEDAVMKVRKKLEDKRSKGRTF
jgi:hypothetical protein